MVPVIQLVQQQHQTITVYRILKTAAAHTLKHMQTNVWTHTHTSQLLIIIYKLIDFKLI